MLCVVRDGAVFGDLELMQDLKTFSHTVVTITYTEVSITGDDVINGVTINSL